MLLGLVAPLQTLSCIKASISSICWLLVHNLSRCDNLGFCIPQATMTRHTSNAASQLPTLHGHTKCALYHAKEVALHQYWQRHPRCLSIWFIPHSLRNTSKDFLACVHTSYCKVTQPHIRLMPRAWLQLAVTHPHICFVSCAWLQR